MMREVTKIVGRLRVVVYVPDSADEADAATLRRIVDACEPEAIASVETGQFSKRHDEAKSDGGIVCYWGGACMCPKEGCEVAGRCLGSFAALHREGTP